MKYSETIYTKYIYIFLVYTEYLYIDTIYLCIDLDSLPISGSTDIWFKTAFMISRCVMCVLLLCPVSDHQNFPVPHVGVLRSSTLESSENKNWVIWEQSISNPGSVINPDYVENEWPIETVLEPEALRFVVWSFCNLAILQKQCSGAYLPSFEILQG